MNTQSDKSGVIFDIQRFSIHDGPGIRTTVFLKGCPLSCAWCHNPESWSGEPELSYVPSSCIGCGKCVSVCPCGAHSISEEGHTLDREKCKGCLACADACPADALSVMGSKVSVGEVMKRVLRDKPFYKSDGGITVSGGEPFYQSEFLISLLSEAKKEGLHTCVETSGAAKLDDMLRALPYVDLFLFDCKLAPGEAHKKYIGTDGMKIRSNLEAIDRAGAKIVLRCPIIPGVNDNREHFEYIRELANSLNGVIEIDLEPYHTTGISKNHSIGKAPAFEVSGFDPRAFKQRITEELMPIITLGCTKKVTI